MKKFFIVAGLFFLQGNLYAQKNNAEKQPVMFTPLFECLKSTHGNLFYSGSFLISKLLNQRYEAGAGIETAFTPKHHDNGFVLYKLKFIPVFANLKYHFKPVGKLDMFTETSVGLSFNKYHRASDSLPNNKIRIKEKGVFVYAGTGARYALSKKINLVSAFGIKGYKMSFNVFDINPHGFCFMFGLNIKTGKS